MQTILILDHGSQYTQLIARKVREANVYCEIHPYNKIPEITDEVKESFFQAVRIQLQTKTLQRQTYLFSRASCLCWEYATVLSIWYIVLRERWKRAR